MTTEKEPSYFEQRLAELGVTDDLNRVISYPENTGTLKLEEANAIKLTENKVFKEDAEGNIEIYFYNRFGLPLDAKRDGSKWGKHFKIIRLKKPAAGEGKYKMPKGSGIYPFLTPGVIDKYNTGKEIPTLVLTEGPFKAFKGYMHGADIIGLTGITHFKDKQTKELHYEIVEIIKKCKVQKIVWLTDGDCNDLPSKAFAPDTKEEIDLYRRPYQFYNSARTIKELLEPYEVAITFAHIESLKHIGTPKGLDDLLISHDAKTEEIVKELMFGGVEAFYFYKQDITHNIAKLHRYFHLHSINDFVSFHADRYKDIQTCEFLFNGTRYRWNNEKAICEVIVPADAKNYCRIADQYYKFITIPNKYQQLEKTIQKRQKSTIMDDHGRNIFTHIQKYEAFCVVPDHQNFQQVIHNCFNLYSPFEHEPDEEIDCQNILNFIRHVFGTGKIKYKDPKTGEEIIYNEWDLGLDYIQLLYQRPTQILPILCLVSKENNTGKSTLSKLLKMIFMQNVAIVGNDDLKNEFNASWASKLLIICDEAKIDKQNVVEKVKALSTADKIMMNAKGKDQSEIDFFGKFMFITNNEENFIYASDDDVRFWVRKVPVIEPNLLNVNLLQDMQDEIPGFLAYLNRRKLCTDNRHRQWFDPALLKTEALRKLIQHSKPTIEKELKAALREMFQDFGVKEIKMALKDISKEFFNNRYETNYLINVLKDNLKVETEKQQRYTYPKWTTLYKDGVAETERIDVKGNGRPYVFNREDYLTADEIEAIQISDEMMEKNMASQLPEPLPSVPQQYELPGDFPQEWNNKN